MISGDYSAEEIKAVLGELDLFAGVRMHSCISAMAMLVPTIAIAYGPKAHGIMGMAGQGRWTINISDIYGGKLSALLHEAWQSRSDIKRSLASEMPKVFSMSRRNVEIIRDMLDDIPQSNDHTVTGVGQGERSCI